MKRLLLSAIAFFLIASGSAQISVSNLEYSSEENNLLKYHISFETSEDCYAYLDYYRVVTDTLGNILDTTWAVTNVQGPGSEHAFIIEEMVEDQTYGFEINAFNTGDCLISDYETFVTDTLPFVVPALDSLYVNPEAELDGYYITNTVLVSDKTMQIWNRDGEVVWYDYHSGEPNVGNAQQCQMFNITDDDHMLLLECHSIEERDLRGNTVNYLSFDDTDADSLFLHHDVIVNSDGNYVAVAASATDYPSGDTSITVVQEHIVEFTPAGELVWQWNAYDHYDPYNAVQSNGFYTALFGADAINWMHINTVMQDNDGNYIVSLKEWHACLKIDSESGDVMWQLGGEGADIEFFPTDQFGDQHHINRTSAGTYIMYDNTGLDTLSRILEFSLDFYDDPLAINEWEYVLPYDNASDILGSAERLPNGNRTAGSGRSGATIEVNSQGEVMWHLEQSAWLYRSIFIQNPFEEVTIEEITIGDNPDLMCYTEGSIELNAMPAGGYWSGDGVEDGSFDPNNAGLGTHTLTYKWGWNTATIEIEVSDAIPPCEVSVNEITSGSALVIYPNPVSNNLTLELDSKESELVVIQIFDLTGKRVIDVQTLLNNGENRIQIDTQGLSNGLYSLQVQGATQNETQTFVVSK